MNGVLKELRSGMLRQGRRVLLAGAVLAAFSMVGLTAEAGSPATVGQPAGSAPAQLDPQRLVGRWVRPDGGYVLALGETTKEGGVKASYFNPRPINVSRAEVRRVAGALTVVVELRDVNYPGSTYTLQYDPASDKLKGTYYQAVEKQTFVVEFVRNK